MSYKKGPHIDRRNASEVMMSKRDYSFVFSDDINHWITNKRVYNPRPKKVQSDPEAASINMKLYHKRMPSIGSRKAA